MKMLLTNKKMLYSALIVVLIAVVLLVFHIFNKRARNTKQNSSAMRVSSRGKSLIKKHEGLRLTAYLCPANVPTIGWGHTRTVTIADVTARRTITRAEAERLLASDIAIHEKPVRELNVKLTQNQYDALVSFVFNIGGSRFRTSTIRRMVLENPDNPAIADEFRRWNQAGGVVLNGLINRRNDEVRLYFS